MTIKNKKTRRRLLREFIKLQIAGNIPFWGTYFGFLFLEKYVQMAELPSLVIATVAANFLFFVVDERWVFETKRQKLGKKIVHSEIIKFAIFVTVSTALNLVIVQSLSLYGGISPYLGLFMTVAFFALWTFVGLRFWVFSPSRRGKAASKQTVRG